MHIHISYIYIYIHTYTYTYKHTHAYIYIYIYCYECALPYRVPSRNAVRHCLVAATEAQLKESTTRVQLISVLKQKLNSKGWNSQAHSRKLPESLSQAILAEIILVARLGV